MAKESQRNEHKNDHPAALLFNSDISRIIFLEQTEPLVSPLRLTFDTFIENCRSTQLVAHIPTHIYEAVTISSRFSRLLMAEKLKRMAENLGTAELTKEQEKLAYDAAVNNMRQERLNLETRDKLTRSVVHGLIAELSDPKFASATHELLRQTLVMLWSGFETFVNDICRDILNTKPDLFEKISLVKPFKDLATPKYILEELITNKYNISNCLGDILIDRVPLDSFEKIQSTLESLISSRDVSAAIGDGRIWKISQQRNLIVHRKGIVDKRYVSATGDNDPIGTKILINALYVEDAFLVVGAAAATIYKESCGLIEKEPT